MFRRTLVSLGTVLVSLLVGLSLAELGLRVFAADRLPKPDLYELDPHVGKRMRADYRTSEFGVGVSTNSHGQRNPEVSFERPTDRVRILAIGDSWTFGYRVVEQHGYPRQLERELNARAGAPAYQVINTGVVGYSTEQEAAYYKAYGRHFSPDLVVLGFYPVNDTDRKFDKYARYNRLRAIHPLLLDIYTFPRQLYVRQFIKGMRRVLKRRVARARVALAERFGYQDAGGQALAEDDWTVKYEPGRRGWQQARRALIELGEAARADGTPVLVVLFPDLLDLPRYLDRFHPKVAPRIEAAVRAAGLGWLDLRESFEPYRERAAEIRFAGQRHPNRAGFAVIASAMADAIESQYAP